MHLSRSPPFQQHPSIAYEGVSAGEAHLETYTKHRWAGTKGTTDVMGRATATGRAREAEMRPVASFFGG
jgi:hypothetical protein